MNGLRQLWRSFFDIRPGERLRVLFMFLYLLFILFAYYILKPLSRALFLSKFDIDKLPWLYILIAIGGGILAYFYSKLAVRASLSTAVFYASAISIGSLVVLWAVLKNPRDWMLYVFNIWVSLFGIVMVSQGWLIAANVFNSREAKRIYGILGIGAVIGAAFGGSFTAAATKLIGVNNLLLASAFFVLLSYAAYLLIVNQPGVAISAVKAASEEEADFRFTDILTAIGHYRHLQVIIGIISLTYIVDVLVEYQFSAMAKASYTSKEALTAFLGSFFGLYLNLLTFFLQFFLTAAVVRTFGVGGTLQIMPVAIAVASIATLLSPSVLSTASARLTEAATRYTFNRTGMELLYLPLPSDLKNRTKAFVDIVVDRFARGVGGMLLLALAALDVETRYVSLVVMVLCVAWMVLSAVARSEYVSTVRKRLESRRLDIENIRISVTDPATLQLLMDTARSKTPRQAAYALSLLGECQGFDVAPLLRELVDNPSDEVRAQVFQLAMKCGCTELLEQAQRELRTWRAGQSSPAIEPATRYVLTHSGEPAKVAERLLQHANSQVQDATISFLAAHRDLAGTLLTSSWLEEMAYSPHAQKRRLAALSFAATEESHASVLVKLIQDADHSVASAALQSAGRLQDRAFVSPMIERLTEARLRGAVVEALKQYGPRISGTLGDLLMDPKVSRSARRHIARVLQHIPHQRSVDALLQAIAEPDLHLRSTVLRSLHRLRESDPKLNYGAESVQSQILKEARTYYELNAALSPFRDSNDKRTAAGLLAKTLEERLKHTIERLFYLLGLRYPPREIYAAYLAVNRGRTEEMSTAIEFLDNVLDRELKRVLLPLFDAPENVAEHGREVFGVERMTTETALRKLLESGDEWLVCCAIATAAQLKIASLSGDVAQLRQGAGEEVGRVAASAAAAFAS
jgi:AAA family ATP:ADP antiporter